MRHQTNLPKIKPSAIIRFLAILVTFIVAYFFAQINTGLFAEGVTLALSFIASLAGYWFDNDVTKLARRRKAKFQEIDRKEIDKSHGKNH